NRGVQMRASMFGSAEGEGGVKEAARRVAVSELLELEGRRRGRPIDRLLVEGMGQVDDLRGGEVGGGRLVGGRFSLTPPLSRGEREQKSSQQKRSAGRSS